MENQIKYLNNKLIFDKATATELVNHLNYNSKGKSYNIACELESVNFLLERILKEYDTETKQNKF
jgi:hypothetical protein